MPSFPDLLQELTRLLKSPPPDVSRQQSFKALVENVTAVCETAPEHLRNLISEPIFDRPDTQTLLTPIFQGILDHLEKQAPGEAVIPFINWMLDRFERNDRLKQNGRIGGGLVLTAARCMNDPETMHRLFPHQLRLAGHRDPEPMPFARMPNRDGNAITGAVRHSVRGKTARSLMLAACRLLEAGESLPAIRQTLLLRFAADAHPGVRAAVLLHLSALETLSSDLAWRLFDTAVSSHLATLWPFGEPFLISQYPFRPTRVGKYLAQAGRQSIPIDPTGWANALIRARLIGDLTEREWLEAFRRVDDMRLWETAFSLLADRITTAPQTNSALGAFQGLISVIPYSKTVVARLEMLFQALETTGGIDIIFQIAYKWITVFDGTVHGSSDLGWFYDWLCRQMHGSPGSAEQLIEIFFTRLEESPGCFDQWQGGRYFTRLTDALASARYRVSPRIVCGADRIGRRGQRISCTKSSSDSRKGHSNSSPIRPISF